MNFKKIIFLLGFLLPYLTIQAQWTQIGNDIDGVIAEEQFGWSVSLSDDGSILAAGAPYNDDGNDNAGQVRLYQNVNGDWVQLGQSISGITIGEGFGRAISMSADGSIVAAGAPFYGDWAGRVRVYQNQNGVWTQLGQDLEAQSNGELFGNAISLSDDGMTLAVGAIYNNVNGAFTGQARIFQYTNGSWVQIGNNLSGDAENDFFGYSVSLSADGEIVAISAAINTSNGSSNIAYTRVYQNTNGNWVQLGQDINGDTVGDQLGSSISISADGTTLALGATSADGGNGDFSGEVRVYAYNNGDWTQVGQGIPGEAAWNFFGSSVSLSTDGTIVAAGASASDDNGMDAGHARVFKNTNGIWVQVGHDIIGEAAEDRFGAAVALNADGTILAAGASLNDGNGNIAGHVRVFAGIIDAVEDYPELESNVSIFPNPTTGKVQLIATSGQLGQISVLDISGRILLSTPYTDNTSEGAIDFSAFANGVYFIRIQAEKTIRTVRVVKQ